MLDDLASRGNKVARAFQGVTGVTGTGAAPDVQRGAYAKALLNEAKLFDGVGKSAEKLGKILTGQVGQSQKTLKKQFEDSTKALDLLMKKHDEAINRAGRLRAGGADPARIQLADQYVNRIGGQVSDAAGAKLNAQAAVDAFKSPQGQGMFRSMMGSLGMLSTVGAVLATSRIAQAAVNIPGSLIMAPHQAMAERGGILGATYMGAMRGNLGDLVALDATLTDPDRQRGRYWAREAAYTGQIGKLISGVIPFTGTSFSEGVVNNIATWGEQQQNAVLGWDPQRAALERAKDPLKFAQIDALQARAGRDVAGMRMFGGPGTLQALRVAGGAMGMMPGEEIGTVGGMAGVGGYSTAMQAFRGGAFAGAIRGGMDRGAAGSAAMAELLGGGNLLGRGTGLDLSVQNQLAGSVAGRVLDPSKMLVSGEGYQGMLTAGINPGQSSAMQLRILQQNQVGMQAMGGLFAGGDAFQQSQNLVNAIDVLGPGASLYAQSKLSKLGKDPGLMAEIMGGGRIPGQLTGVGIGRGDVQAMADRTLGSVLTRYRDIGGGGPGGKLLENMMAMDPSKRQEYLRSRSAEQIAQMGGVLAEAAPEMFDDVSGEAFFRQWGHMGRKTGKGPGRRDMAAGTPEMTALNTQIQALVTNFDKVGMASDKVVKELERLAGTVGNVRGLYDRAPGLATGTRVPFMQLGSGQDLDYAKVTPVKP